VLIMFGSGPVEHPVRLRFGAGAAWATGVETP